VDSIDSAPSDEGAPMRGNNTLLEQKNIGANPVMPYEGAGSELIRAILTSMPKAAQILSSVVEKKTLSVSKNGVVEPDITPSLPENKYANELSEGKYGGFTYHSPGFAKEKSRKAIIDETESKELNESMETLPMRMQEMVTDRCDGAIHDGAGSPINHLSESGKDNFNNNELLPKSSASKSSIASSLIFSLKTGTTDNIDATSTSVASIGSHGSNTQLAANEQLNTNTDTQDLTSRVHTKSNPKPYALDYNEFRDCHFQPRQPSSTPQSPARSRTSTLRTKISLVPSVCSFDIPDDETVHSLFSPSCDDLVIQRQRAQKVLDAESMTNSEEDEVDTCVVFYDESGRINLEGLDTVDQSCHSVPIVVDGTPQVVWDSDDSALNLFENQFDETNKFFYYDKPDPKKMKQSCFAAISPSLAHLGEQNWCQDTDSTTIPNTGINLHSKQKETLLGCSTLTKRDFSPPKRKEQEKSKYAAVELLALVTWRLMVARWKHAEMVRSMTACPPSHHFTKHQRNVESSSNESQPASGLSAEATHRSGRKNFASDALLWEKMLSSASNNLSGFCPSKLMNDPDMPKLSTFLAEFGPLPYCTKNLSQKEHSDPIFISHSHHVWPTSRNHCSHSFELRHNITNLPLDSCNHAYDGANLRDVAQSCLVDFTNLLDSVVAFASQNTSQINSENSLVHRPEMSVSIKLPEAIQEKAVRKYGGDVNLVKDVLRGQIVLHDEASLVCALICLRQLSFRVAGDQGELERVKEVSNGFIHFDIVRIKNLFRKHLGTMVPTDLPTSYRHVLVNIRLKNGLLAEIQFQLRALFDIIGNEGYKLHRQALDIQKLSCKKHQPSFIAPDSNVLQNLSQVPIMLCRCVENDGKNDSRNSVHELVLGFCNMHKLIECYQSDNKAEDTMQNKKDVEDTSYTSKSMQKISNILSQLPEAIIGFSPVELSGVLASTACADIDENPHDLSLYLCLYQVYVTRYSLTEDSFDRDNAEKAVGTSLEIIDHSNAVGMVGWLDYGKSHVLDRTLERPFEALSDLAAFHASNRDWEAAQEVLCSLVLRCEQHLPLYHPIVISALLDLASSFLSLGKRNHAVKITQRASKRLSMYLGEQEQACSMMHSMHNKSSKSDPDPIGYHKHMGLDHLAMLKAFVSNMRYLRRRMMLTVLGRKHPMSLLFDNFLGDSLSVLGICLEFESLNICSKDSKDSVDERLSGESKLVWMVAGEYYRTALKGWTESNGMRHPNVPSTACGLARCLRELGRRKEALKVLSSVIASRHNVERHQKYKTHEALVPVPLTIKPPALSGGWHTIVSIQSRYSHSIAICLWSMAIYVVEETRNENGRMRAHKLLHTAIEEIQSSIDAQVKCKEKSIDNRCNELLTTLENEAKNLFSTYKIPCSGKGVLNNDSHEQSAAQKELVQNFGDGQRQAVVSV